MGEIDPVLLTSGFVIVGYFALKLSTRALRARRGSAAKRSLLARKLEDDRRIA